MAAVAGPDRASAFIRANLRFAPVPGLPGIGLHAPHPASGLGRLTRARVPYWAYVWAGGLALAHHLLANPDIVAGKRVLDFGCGSGLVAIVAARAGAADVVAVDTDANALAAAALNAQANGVCLRAMASGGLDGAVLPAIDVLLAGDVFYAPALARRVMPLLRRCAAAGIEVLVGDPGRASLPAEQLDAVAVYRVPDMGAAGSAGPVEGRVYRLRNLTRV